MGNGGGGGFLNTEKDNETNRKGLLSLEVMWREGKRESFNYFYWKSFNYFWVITTQQEHSRKLRARGQWQYVCQQR